MLGQALKLEGKESGDLITNMIRPKGAKKIIDILHKLAAIDDDIAQEEIDLINQFSEKWNIEIPDLKPDLIVLDRSKVNPSSLILSAGMMLNHIGWKEASDNVIKGISWAIKNKLVTYDLERLMKGAKLLKCSEFAEQICNGMT